MNYRLTFVLSIFLCSSSYQIIAQTKGRQAELWADSLMAKMSPEQRTAQLFMVAAYSKSGSQTDAAIMKLVKDTGIGGLIFMKGGPGRQLLQTNAYQSAAKIPLLISIDGEWGLAMRLDSTMAFPWQMTLGAIQNNQLIEEMGAQIAKQCRRVGIAMNMAPVVDVNNNPKNPVIKARSFGDNPQNVAIKGIAYMKGLQQNGVLASAKHFPGHGDTDTDSHLALPQIKHNRSRLDTIELYPFRELIAAGLGSVMVAHLSVPALDATPKLATTLSHAVVTGILRNEMRFEGLIVTDALNMKGVSDYYQEGEVDVMALLAGNDILLFSGNVPLAILKIHEAIQQNKITREEVDRRCKKVLMAKFMLGLNQFTPLSLEGLQDDLFSTEARLIHKKLTAESLTLIKNENQLIPFRELEKKKFASVCFQCDKNNPFQERLRHYSNVDCIAFKELPTPAEILAAAKQLEGANTLIFSVHQPNESPFKSPVIPEAAIKAMEILGKDKAGVLVSFANPYALRNVRISESIHSVLVSYQNNEDAQDLSAQLLFGAIPSRGKLPVEISKMFPSGWGIQTEGGLRLRYGLPEESGMKSQHLKSVDDIVHKAIKDGEFPGCQIWVAHKGTVVFNRAYGYHTYDKSQRVSWEDLYDLASITKVASTVPNLMKLVGEGRVSIDQTLKDLVPSVAQSNKASLSLRDILAHQAGLKAWIPFHLSTMDKAGNHLPGYYASTFSEDYPIEVAKGLYAWKGLPDSLFSLNLKSDINASKSYLYSDLGYYYLSKIIKSQQGNPLDVLMDSLFSGPLGAYSLTYNPLKLFPENRIVPTEQDGFFRKQLIRGYVHDQGAALMGGVAGHAGLFSNANDLGKLLQMFLNYGSYGGETFIKPEVIKEFVRCQFCSNGNRRALGFDKPSPSGKGGTACDCVSYLSFGHSGFTGTLAWADPKHELLFVFLSNRVHPNAENKLIIQNGTRAKIQQLFYEAIS
jgi:beta-N-acetylhexosaminidase